MSKFALVIANTNYTDPGLAQLSAPGKDAEDFARVLRSQDICAFEDVKVFLNEPEPVIREAIDEFFSQKKPDDLLVLYFSGHGVRDENGSLYLAVSNTNRFRLRSTAVKSDFIKESMDQSRSKRQVLILDCCNSGAFAQGTKAATGGSIGTASAFEGTGYGHVVLTASDSTQFAWEGDQVIGATENSLFTHFLVKGLDGEADRNGDGRITIDELYDYAYEQIVRVTPKQTPSKWSYKEQGEITLRQSIRIEDIKPVSLPEELVNEIESLYPEVRLRAVQGLVKLLNSKNLGLVRSSKEALECMAAGDDSRRVAQAATEVLASLHQSEQLAKQKAEEERLAREKAESEQMAEYERLAREQAEREAMEKAVREEAQRLVAERIAKEKAEREATEKAARELAEREEVEKAARELAEQEAAQRLAAEKATREAAQRLADEKAVKEKAEREAAEKSARKKTKRERIELLQNMLVQGYRFTLIKFKNTKLLGLSIIFFIAVIGFIYYSYTTITNATLFFSGREAGKVSIYKYDGKKPTQYMTTGDARDWSPSNGFDGYLYFVSDRDGKVEIYRSKVAGVVERVTYTDGQAESWSPASSLDGYIYFVSNRDGKAEIYRSNATVVAERVTYTEGQAESWGPVSSLDGYLYFVSNRDGKAEIYRSNATVVAERVTHTEGQAESWGPVSSLDGYLYFVSNRDGKAEIYRSNATVVAERVTHTEGQAESWGPIVLGLNIYFTSNKSNQNEIYKLGNPPIAISNIESWTKQSPLENKTPR